MRVLRVGSLSWCGGTESSPKSEDRRLREGVCWWRRSESSRRTGNVGAARLILSAETSRGSTCGGGESEEEV
eukprot:superscaffoldBa00007703_g22760